MPPEKLNVDFTVEWKSLSNDEGERYRWGEEKRQGLDPNWSHSKVIYRWVRSSTHEIAHIGETCRTLTKRVNNYISAKPGNRAGNTNRKVYNEQQRLTKLGDYLFLEFTCLIPGYELLNDRERKLAESLLIGYYKPYLFEVSYWCVSGGSVIPGRAPIRVTKTAVSS